LVDYLNVWGHDVGCNVCDGLLELNMLRQGGGCYGLIVAGGKCGNK